METAVKCNINKLQNLLNNIEQGNNNDKFNLFDLTDRNSRVYITEKKSGIIKGCKAVLTLEIKQGRYSTLPVHYTVKNFVYYIWIT